MSDPKNPNQINIELNEEIAQGTYSNLAVITHSSSEFVIDFVRIMPGIPKAQVKSRIILTPEHAKRLVAALQDNIAKYEIGIEFFEISEDDERILQEFLDTLDEMESARELYASLGFEEVAPYYYNPIPGAHYLKAPL